MKPDDARLGHLLDDMEKALKLKATRLAPDHPRGFIEEILYQAEFANTRGEMSRVETLLSDTLALEPENATAIERLGSLRYLTGRLPEAIAAWETAAKIETRDRELESLREYLRMARERAGILKPVPGGAIAIPAETPAPAPAGKPGGVEKLYQQGVEDYAHGDYLEARAKFLHVLQIDPKNEQARQALERIDSRRSRQ
jgi:cytochrome c-type biogenesis protein CcmH/NrfG